MINHSETLLKHHYNDVSEEFLNGLSFNDATELNDWVYDECGDEYTYFLDKVAK